MCKSFSNVRSSRPVDLSSMDPNPACNVLNERKTPSAATAKPSNSLFITGNSLLLLNRIQKILADKAPEAIPLLEEFVSSLPSLSKEVVEAEKRERSMVLFGVPEADINLPPSQRQACTVSFVTGLLDVLNVEAHPVELYRMGAMMQDKPRLDWVTELKCIPVQQHGFLPGASTCSQLIDCTHSWIEAINSGRKVSIIYFDLTKAFDTVCRSSLLVKLASIGVRGRALRWFQSYLSGWKMRVRFSNYVSTARDCTSGVPQGGSLSPLLFLIYTYDLVTYIRTDTRLLIAAYADDIKISVAFDEHDKESAQNLLNEAVERMINWCTHWRLNINPNKTYLLTLGPPQLEICFPDGTPIRKCDNIKDLGVILSKSLKWSDHIEIVSKKGLRLVHMLFRNVHSSEATVWIKLYKMYVLPVVEYCSPVWSPSLKGDIQKLERIQKTFTRILFYRVFPSRNYPQALPGYQERLKKLNLRSLYYRRIQSDLILAFKLLKGELRIKPSTYWTFLPTSGRRGSFRILNHKMGKWRRELWANSFIVRAAKWLEAMPTWLLEITNSNQFKKAIKKMNILDSLGIPDIA